MTTPASSRVAPLLAVLALLPLVALWRCWQSSPGQQPLAAAELPALDTQPPTVKTGTQPPTARIGTQPPTVRIGRDELRLSKTLRLYGLPACSWMSVPLVMRYPRTRKVAAPQAMRECVDRLWQWQEQGDILFQMLEGQGLGATAAGGFHGNFDDGDLDIKMISQLQQFPTLYAHCPGFDLGQYGFQAWPHTEGTTAFQRYFSNASDTPWTTAPHKNAEKQAWAEGEMRKWLGNGCICQWEEWEVLCVSQPPYNYWRKGHGGSWWVPPMKGGKAVGDDLIHYLNPANSLYGYFGWFAETQGGLAILDKDPKDNMINMREFLAYVRSTPRVNQLWLERATADEPCIVANAQIHYNHTLYHTTWGIQLKASKEFSAQEKWANAQERWEPVPYTEDVAMCRALLEDTGAA